ncbi:MAG TPA: TonB-dependent receptor plug domain-containing protein [Steroidobacteraceae bacterium]|nr:TonB-dependent receptor plug domain-containing protein [Steroidobacteraceae bacterium]
MRGLSASVSFGLVLGAVVATPVLAEQAASSGDGLQEVIVTAEKRSDTAQRTPLSLQVVAGDSIDKLGENSIDDVLKDVPAVLTRNSAKGLTIEMRGISNGGVPNNDAAAAVGLSTDGVYDSLSGSASQVEFFDINRVEVLRGPQGTLYGVGAEGGVVNIITNNPVEGQFDAAGSLEGGNYGLIRVGGYVNTPLSDTVAVRAAYDSVNRKGYYTSGSDDQVSTSGRLKVLIKPSEDFSLLLGDEYSRLGGKGTVGGRNAGIDAWGRGSPPVNAWDDLSTGLWAKQVGQTYGNNKVWGQLDWTVGNVGTLMLLPSYIVSHGYSFKAEPPAVAGVTPPAYNIADDYHNTVQRTAEARFSSLPAARIRWQVGYFYSYQQVYDNTSDTMFFTYDPTVVTPKSSAEYGQVTVPVGSFRFTAGARESHDSKSFTNGVSGIGGTPAAGNHSWTHFDWKLSAEQDLSSDSLAYLTVATGYRPGAVNAGSSTVIQGPSGPIPNPNEYTNPETLISYELGSKNEFFDHTLRANVDVYFEHYSNRLYNNFYFVPLPGVCGNGAVPGGGPPGYGNCGYEANGGVTDMRGVEAETQWLISTHDVAALNLSYLDARNSLTPVILTNLAAGYLAPIGGHTPPNSPRWQANAYYEHGFDLPQGRLTPRVSVRYTSESAVNSYNYLNDQIAASCNCRKGDFWIQQAYTQFDASLAYASSNGRWTLTGYIKNIGNVVVKTDTDGYNTTVGAPRTFGAVLSVHPAFAN